MICKRCGKEIEYGHIACPFCGELVDFSSNSMSGINWDANETTVDEDLQLDNAEVIEEELQPEDSVVIEEAEIEKDDHVYESSPIPDYKAVTPVMEEPVRFNWEKKPYNQTKTPVKGKVNVDYHIARGDRQVIRDKDWTQLIIRLAGLIIIGILSYFAAKDKELNSYENRSKNWEMIDNAMENYDPYEGIPEEIRNEIVDDR